MSEVLWRTNYNINGRLYIISHLTIKPFPYSFTVSVYNPVIIYISIVTLIVLLIIVIIILELCMAWPVSLTFTSDFVVMSFHILFHREPRNQALLNDCQVRV